MPRPKYKDRSKLKRRVNVSMKKETRKKASRIGDGNVSRGIEIAVEDYEVEE